MDGHELSEIVKCIIRSDRRLVTLRCFGHSQFLGVSEIAQETGRSIQNISTGLKELDAMRIVEQLEPARRTWKKYRLTSMGRTILDSVERELSAGMFERMADELSFRYVKDAYRLVVTDPIIVTKQMRLHEVVDRVLADPRTRSAYVVDDKRRLLGMIGLKQMLTAIESSLTVVDKGRTHPRSRHAPLPFSVEEYMVRPVTVSPDDRLLTALQKMMRSGLEDLPVVDEEGTIVGELNGFEILLLGSEVMKRQSRAGAD
ncbi:MAG: hypothetical protein A3K67_05965 [Euryarchaeota archaeon RBG_16_62_10]|nr:MAG: hypothetical protein A3K67_05965 [Euryarchaeota archaeon RBG_16_62_10]